MKKKVSISNSNIMLYIGIFLLVLPILGTVFNPKVPEIIYKIDLYSGLAVRTTIISILVIIICYSIIRAVYLNGKSTNSIRISITSFVLNLLSIILFLIGSTIIYKIVGIDTISQLSGTVISISLFSILITMIYEDIEIYQRKDNQLPNIQIGSILAMLATTLITGLLLAFSRTPVSDQVMASSLPLWNLIYLLLVRKSILRYLIKV
ncbi:hypothetical protein JW710_02950 [Candidatus Dojkabacteria bacterium]|nr:hypothetical protein [Candidatus Dojkabacteria bacterium]